jgi:hypothetical protein
MISTSTKRTLFSDPSADLDVDAHRFSVGQAVWNGFLHEFRNRLTVLMGATVGDAFFETEHNVQGLTSLVALLDASVRTADPVIAPLGDVVDRAVRLASHSVGRRASVVTKVPREVGVRNRGTALEALLAALAIDLVKSHPGADTEVGNVGSGARVRIDADIGRRGLNLEVACAGAHMESSPASWRRVLATELAIKLDAALTVHPEDSAYVVQLR